MATFGTTTIRTLTTGFGGVAKLGARYTLPVNGNLTKITGYIRKNTPGNCTAKATCYTNVAGDPAVPQGVSNEITIDNVFAWEDFTYIRALIAADYWITITASANFDIRYENLGGLDAWKYVVYANEFTNPFRVHTDGTLLVSFYATYTPPAAAGGQTGMYFTWPKGPIGLRNMPKLTPRTIM